MSSERRLDFPLDIVPKVGSLTYLNDHVRWIRMPLPMSLNHINLWGLGSSDNLTLVDTGMHLDDTKNAWINLIKEQNLTIKDIVVTHMHPDHIGMAGWFVKECNTSFSMSRSDYLQCRMLSADTGDNVPHEAIDFYTQAGMTEGQIKTFIKRFGFFGSIIHPLPEAYTRLKDSDVLNVDGIEWAVIEGRGHSLEHLCFFSKELNMFISGDQLLPTISSHVGIFPTEPKANPVEEWIASCYKLIDVLPQDVFVLPAHGRPFIGAHKRLHALIEHHETSLSKLYDALKTPKRSVDVFDVLFKREIDEGNLIMATGESLAHLNCLIYRGQIRKYLKDGHSWYEQI